MHIVHAIRQKPQSNLPGLQFILQYWFFGLPLGRSFYETRQVQRRRGASYAETSGDQRRSDFFPDYI
jgi:hypothetical protein